MCVTHYEYVLRTLWSNSKYAMGMCHELQTEANDAPHACSRLFAIQCVPNYVSRTMNMCHKLCTCNDLWICHELYFMTSGYVSRTIDMSQITCHTNMGIYHELCMCHELYVMNHGYVSRIVDTYELNATNYGNVSRTDMCHKLSICPTNYAHVS